MSRAMTDYEAMLENEFLGLSDEAIRDLRAQFLGRGRQQGCTDELIRRARPTDSETHAVQEKP